jgi:hypothetical protein
MSNLARSDVSVHTQHADGMTVKSPTARGILIRNSKSVIRKYVGLFTTTINRQCLTITIYGIEFVEQIMVKVSECRIGI